MPTQSTRNELGKIHNDNQTMLELEALRDENQRVKEDSRQNEERVAKLESEIKKFSLFFLSSESRPTVSKPKK
jgi:hypothetical protein